MFRRNLRLEVQSAATGVVSEIREQFSFPLLLLLATVGMVLLIACANVASLLSARAVARQREIAVRVAIGAGRIRLLRQLLTESLLLAALAGAAGVLLAYWGSGALIRMVSTGRVDNPINVPPDLRILAFALTISLLTGILFGAAPTLRAIRVDITPTLKGDAIGQPQGRSRLGLANSLVIFQVALSLLLLTGTGLLVRSLQGLRAVNPGFNPQGVLLFTLNATSADNRGERRKGLYERLREKIEALPGIEGASFSFVSPLGGNWAEKITVPGYQPRTVRDDGVFRQIESPGYFSALGIPVLLGRDFELRDVATAPKWAIVNEAAVQMYFGTENPIGRRIGLGPGAQPDIEIVGVVGDTKFNGLRQPVPRLVYTPALQQDVFVPTGVTFEVRTAGDPLGLVNGIQHEVQALDKTLPIYNIRSLSTEISDSLIRERLTTRLSILFSALALLLACVGLYGLLAYRVVEKNHEIGLRMALGAKKGDVLKMVMGRGLRLVTIGIGIGIAAALALTRFLSTLLYGVKPTDELTFIEVSLLLTCVALLASYIPARRATKVDPMVALRYE